MERTKKESQKIVESTDDKVWVSVEFTVNLGNYENVKIAGGISRTLKSNENPFEIREEMTDQLFGDMQNMVQNIKKENKRK